MHGTLIRKYRIQKEFSQEYMASQLNICQEAYSKIELNKTELTVKRLYQIASILGIPIYELLSEENIPNSI
ncbi:MAG TPA: helix-turn-helix transcriptional regulator [Sphingobacteriaceae bacterium]|nr:helix-turn-helix transcriptional regulator [Sphingobacteriaceae bacterium]